MFNCRPVRDDEAALLLNLARLCPPLDVHTPYTYWVICHLYGATTMVLEDDGTAIGYLMAVPRNRSLFLWQVGILESHRGRGLATLLFDALAAATKGDFDTFELTIAPENGPSNAAFASWCRKNGLTPVPLHPIDVPEHEEPGETLFEVLLAAVPSDLE